MWLDCPEAVPINGWLDRLKTFAGRWVPFVPLSEQRAIEHFARRRGYAVAEVLCWGRTCRLHKEGKDYLFKRTGPNGLIAYRDVLPAVDGDFKRLVLPRFVDGGHQSGIGHWIISRWLEGRNFNDRWDEWKPEVCGGKGIALDYVDVLLDVLEDLRGVEASPFAAGGIERRTRSFLCSRIRGQLDRALQGSLLTAGQERRALDLLEPFLARVDSGRLRLSNHDFYFRNFLEMPRGRIGILDWDAARISTYEIEHCVTYLWMLMWNHSAWSAALLEGARSRFALDRHQVRAALLVNLLNQSMHVWPNRPELSRMLLATFLEALDDAGFSAIWRGRNR